VNTHGGRSRRAVLLEDSELNKHVCEANPLSLYYRQMLQIGSHRLAETVVVSC